VLPEVKILLIVCFFSEAGPSGLLSKKTFASLRVAEMHEQPLNLLWIFRPMNSKTIYYEVLQAHELENHG
jgi:hypothetical protein